MKKILLSLVALVAVGSIYAQNISFGVKGGVNVSGFHGKDADGTPLKSFHLGVVSEFYFTDKCSIQPEILYSSIGGTKEKDFRIKKLDLTQKIDYISVPVMAKYYLFKGLAVELGPQFSYAISRSTNSDDILAKLKGLPAPTLGAIGKKIDFPYNKFDVALGAGISYNLPYGIFASARYVYSFTNYPKSSVGKELKPQVIQVSLGYKF